MALMAAVSLALVLAILSPVAARPNALEKRDAPEKEAMTAREEANNSFSFIYRNSLFGKLNPSLLSNLITFVHKIEERKILHP